MNSHERILEMVRNANQLRRSGRLSEAEAEFRLALESSEGLIEPLIGLGNTLHHLSRFDEAIACYEKALELNPNSFEAWNDLTVTKEKIGDHQGALHAVTQALRLKPEHPLLYSNLGNIFTRIGQQHRAVNSYRKALQYRPHFHQAHSNMLLTMNYLSSLSDSDLFEQHLAYGEQHANHLSLNPYHQIRDLGADRPLRIGYVSPDFQNHPVATFIEGLVRSHDQDQFSVSIFSDVTAADSTTNRIMQSASSWIPIQGLSDESLAQIIADQKIDILIDLTGHTANNRLLAFARKPAPIQISYLGYPHTTGIKAMDYKLVDQWTDPIGNSEFYSEKLIRLPRPYLAYTPAETYRGPSLQSPFKKNGFVTYGSFNNPAKITPFVIQAWAEILKRVPQSKLLMKATGITGAQIQSRLISDFESLGVKRDRISFAERSFDRYEAHHLIDIHLDTFPYQGVATTCDALAMGVCVVSLDGTKPASRSAASLFQSVGTLEFLAQTPAEYVRKAVFFGLNPEALVKIRENLGARMLRSELCDSLSLARMIEEAFRRVWKSH